MKKINKCPLCKSSKNSFYSNLDKNLYSEKLSEILKVDENILISKIKNLKCSICGLVFKNFLINPNHFNKIFNKFIPNHPRGIDVGSKKFSKDNFDKLIPLINKNYNNKDFNQYSREIKSIISSIPNFSKNKDLKWILNNKKRDFGASLDIKKLNSKKNKIRKHINIPAEFKRFSGYSSENLYKYFSKKFPFLSYGELGCSQWGLLSLMKNKGKKIYFVKRTEKNFWNKNCKIGRINCLLSKKKKLNFKIINFNQRLNKNKRIDLLGVFQYLDHVSDPLKFIKNLTNLSKKQAFIVDNFKKMDKKVYIQHFTGWSEKPLKWAAKKLNKTIISDFKNKNFEENSLFILK